VWYEAVAPSGSSRSQQAEAGAVGMNGGVGGGARGFFSAAFSVYVVPTMRPG